MPPPYHSTPNQSKSNLDSNMNSSLTNRNHNSSPLIGYEDQTGGFDQDKQFDKCKRNEEFRLFDPNESVYLDDGMGFDLQSVLSMELLENVSNNPRLVEAKNEEVLRRVAEMQRLVENSEQYLTENADDYGENDLPYKHLLRDEFVGKETSVDQVESDSESMNSRMSAADDAPGILKHSDSLLLLTETINQGLSGLAVPTTNEDKDSNGLNRRQSQGLSAILNNCGLTDALIALNNDLSQSESDNDSLYTPTNSPIRNHHSKNTNKAVRTSFGLHSPDNSHDGKEQQKLKEYLKQLREKSSREEQKIKPCVEVSPFYYIEDSVDNDAELIDLTLIPPPQTPDELDCSSQVPQVLPLAPASFADEKDYCGPESGVDTCDAPHTTSNSLEEFIANVTIQPPTVKVTPAVELTPEQIMSYIIPPPPLSNSSTLDRDVVSYVNHTQLHSGINKEFKPVENNRREVNKASNGDIVKGTLSVSEIRNMFTAKTLSDARNSLLLREKNAGKHPPQSKTTDSPRSKRKSVPLDKHSNGTVTHVIEYPTVERKGMFSCCSKDKKHSSLSSDISEESDIESKIGKSESIPDVCEIRPPPRRKNLDNGKPPDRPPKSAPAPAPRPRSNSFSYPNHELTSVEIPNNHFSTLNNRKLTYKIVCDANESTAPRVPPRLERGPLSPPPPILLPPKKPPLPPVPSLEVLRLKTSQKLNSPTRNPEQRLASIGSPHFQRNLNTYRNLETESASETPSPTRHMRSSSESKSTILKNGELSIAASPCSPLTSRRLGERPDLLNGATGSPKSQNHVRFKETSVEDIPTPPSPPSVRFTELGGGNGRAPVSSLLVRSETAVSTLLQRLHAVAAHCAHQHSHGGGEDIDELKFQVSYNENTIFMVC